jgi:hypothetical protein
MRFLGAFCYEPTRPQPRECKTRLTRTLGHLSSWEIGTDGARIPAQSGTP